MSLSRYSRIPARAAQDRALSLTDLRVLTALGRYVDKEGRAFPSLTTLATAAGLDRRKVSAPIAKLERLGYVTRSRRAASSGDFDSTIYQVNFEGEEVAPPEVPGSTSPGATGSASGGATVVPPQGPGGGTSPGALTTQDITTHSTAHVEGAQSLDPAGDRFDEFWLQFPKQRRADRAKVLAKYKALIKVKAVTHDELLAAVMRYAASRDVIEGFACAPLRWLREERWKLEYQPYETPTNSAARANGQGRTLADAAAEMITNTDRAEQARRIARMEF